MASGEKSTNTGGKDQSTDFEGSFKKLQDVVRLLSEGNLTLQESLAAFEEGMGLAESCASMLEQAELRVKEVSERSRQSASSPPYSARLALDSDIEPDLLTFEFERTIIVESGLSGGLDTEDLDNLPAPKKRTQANGRQKTSDSFFDDLDPLFDEED